MPVMMGTSDGVWKWIDHQPQRIGLAGKATCHVANHDGITLAAAPYEGLYAITDAGERLLWQGDARACAIAPDGAFFVGTEPAMIYRSDDRGETWRRSDQMDCLPTRSQWYFPPPPHEPHVRSIDVIPGHPDHILVGVEVGGVLRSSDGGETWTELNNGIYVDVHAVHPDPLQSGRLLAVTGRGFYASEDDGASWEPRMEGMAHRYTVGLDVSPYRVGEVLVTAGEGPPGVHACIYHSPDAGRHWEVVAAPALPEAYDQVPVVFFAEDAAWIATQQGQIFRSEATPDRWSQVGELPARIQSVSADGRAVSVSSGYRR